MGASGLDPHPGRSYTPAPVDRVSAAGPGSTIHVIQDARNARRLTMPGKKLNQKDLDAFDGMLRQMLGVISGDLEVLETTRSDDVAIVRRLLDGIRNR